jgi:hypothetical protein
MDTDAGDDSRGQLLSLRSQRVTVQARQAVSLRRPSGQHQCEVGLIHASSLPEAYNYREPGSLLQSKTRDFPKNSPVHTKALPIRKQRE